MSTWREGPNGFHWREGPVDTACEHAELRAREKGHQLVARVAPGPARGFVVEFVTPEPELREACEAELDLYLLDVGGAAPWAYVRYHATTASNAYAKIRWALSGPTPR